MTWVLYVFIAVSCFALGYTVACIILGFSYLKFVKIRRQLEKWEVAHQKLAKDISNLMERLEVWREYDKADIVNLPIVWKKLYDLGENPGAPKNLKRLGPGEREPTKMSEEHKT